MSLGQIRILALTLPTVAVAVISILWFRSRQKKRRPRVDPSWHKEPAVNLQTEEEDSHTAAELIDYCMSAKTALQLAPAPVEVSHQDKALVEGCINKEGSELKINKPVVELTNYLLNSVDRYHIESPKQESNIVETSCQMKSKTTESSVKETLQTKICSQPEDTILKSQEKSEDPVDVNVQVTSKIETIHNIKSSGCPEEKIKNQRLTKSSLSEAEYSDLEEGEIRSPNISLVGTKQNSEDSVFERELEESPFRQEEPNIELEETESDLEEGEIRSLDGRTEEIMKKEKDQLTEKLASLELDQMKKSSEHKELPSLELEQMKLDDRKSGSERDSANHSPSEVMLASPSISNFSDAHSEGSSDSGKGQSDTATSPPRTPAGGSSLAGDQAPSVYEFVLPQIIVGRLIGRHGTFLHEIKTQTHTNIFIKRHPDSNKLKICAIEGTQQDIDKALAKIRQKFPLRRFPQLTLEKVSFVQLNPLPPLKPEDFHLQLVEGVNNDVVLSSLISAAHFFLQQPCHPSYGSLAALNNIMSQLYSSGEAPILETPVTYAVCAAPAMGGWYRAQIVHVEEDGQACTVRYLDYGGYSRIQTPDLRQIRGDLLALPFQAVECYLANVAPPPGEDDWSEEARLFVQSLTCGQVLQAQVYDYADDGVPLVYLYSSVGNQVVLINEELVVQGYAVIAENGSTCGTASASEDGGRTDEEGARTDDGSTTMSKDNGDISA